MNEDDGLRRYRFYPAADTGVNARPKCIYRYFCQQLTALHTIAHLHQRHSRCTHMLAQIQRGPGWLVMGFIKRCFFVVR